MEGAALYLEATTKKGPVKQNFTGPCVRGETRGYCRSKRSRFITLVQAATKSRANFSLASSLA